jgi:hypothetical protein
MSGNLISDKLYGDYLFLGRIIWHYKEQKLSEYDGRFTLYEEKDGELIRPIDDYMRNKPLNYKHKFQFTLKNHRLRYNRDKKFTEFYYQSAYKDDSDERI